MDINITNPVTASKIGSVVNAAASATPNDTDLVMSVESSVAKKNTWTQIKAFLKTYFDGIYTTTAAVATQISTAISGKEDTSNKSSSYTLSSTTTYANTKALVDGLATKQNTLTNPVTGTGTTNEITYMTGTSTIGSLTTATYPSLTELAYVKGVTSAIQTQINTKVTSGGALGTPSSGTLTNCTGLPISGIVGYEGYALTAFHTTTNPADATTLYWGSDFILAASSTPNILRIYPPKAGTLKAVFLKTRCTAGSNESVGISIIKNNTTTTSLGSIDLSATQTNNIFSGLNISFNGTTDYLEMIYDATTWATNPTNLRGYAALYFE